jgi:AFG3 family protein
MLGGTASEQIFLGGMSSGNSDDLQKVYKTARRMVTQFGMGVKTYNMTLDEQTYVKKESEKLCNTMDNEMLSLVNEGTERANTIITEKREIVEQLAKELLEK